MLYAEYVCKEKVSFKNHRSSGVCHFGLVAFQGRSLIYCGKKAACSKICRGVKVNIADLKHGLFNML